MPGSGYTAGTRQSPCLQKSCTLVRQQTNMVRELLTLYGKKQNQPKQIGRERGSAPQEQLGEKSRVVIFKEDSGGSRRGRSNQSNHKWGAQVGLGSKPWGMAVFRDRGGEESARGSPLRPQPEKLQPGGCWTPWAEAGEPMDPRETAGPWAMERWE